MIHDKDSAPTSSTPVPHPAVLAAIAQVLHHATKNTPPPASTAPVLTSGEQLGRNGRPDIPGLLQRGNIDLSRRPIVHNPDGSISTVRSISVGLNNGQTALIPTVVGNQVVSNDDAIKHYEQTGEHLGLFNDENLANSYAENLHEAQAGEYLPKANAVGALAHHLAIARPAQGNDPRIVASPPEANDPGITMNRFNLPNATIHQDALREFLSRFWDEQVQAHSSRAHDGRRQSTPTPPVFDYARYLQGLA